MKTLNDLKKAMNEIYFTASDEKGRRLRAKVALNTGVTQTLDFRKEKR